MINNNVDVKNKKNIYENLNKKINALKKEILDFDVDDIETTLNYISLENDILAFDNNVKIIIVEGIFALVNKRIRELSDLNIFINASSENRFLRRLKRDQEERGRTFDYVVNQYVNVVAPAYEEIIAPTKMFADLIISNDGIENKSLEILTSIIKMMLEK
jgi:uridine kinase